MVYTKVFKRLNVNLRTLVELKIRYNNITLLILFL